MTAMGGRLAVVHTIVRYEDIMSTKSRSITGTAVHCVVGIITVLGQFHRRISVDVV